VGVNLEENMFGVGASIEKSSLAQVNGELCLFKRLSIAPVACADALIWWCIHEGQFSNALFLSKHIFKILGSQIKIEWCLILLDFDIFKALLLVGAKHGFNYYCGENLA
jgi:hypothetical protein